MECIQWHSCGGSVAEFTAAFTIVNCQLECFCGVLEFKVNMRTQRMILSSTKTFDSLPGGQSDPPRSRGHCGTLFFFFLNRISEMKSRKSGADCSREKHFHEMLGCLPCNGLSPHGEVPIRWMSSSRNLIVAYALAAGCH